MWGAWRQVAGPGPTTYKLCGGLWVWGLWGGCGQLAQAQGHREVPTSPPDGEKTATGSRPNTKKKEKQLLTAGFEPSIFRFFSLAQSRPDHSAILEGNSALHSRIYDTCAFLVISATAEP